MAVFWDMAGQWLTGLSLRDVFKSAFRLPLSSLGLCVSIGDFNYRAGTLLATFRDTANTWSQRRPEHHILIFCMNSMF